MKMTIIDIKKNKLLMNVILLIVSAVLFGFQNAFLAFFLLVPAFFLIQNSSIKSVWIYGGFYNVIGYIFLLTWLFNYSKIAMCAVCFFYFFYGAILFAILKLVFDFFDGVLKKNNYSLVLVILKNLVISLIFVFYEYLKNLGYAGFNFGVLGYTQYKNIFFIQIADIFGVWGVSFLLVLCNTALFEMFNAILFTRQRGALRGERPLEGVAAYRVAARGRLSPLLFFLCLAIFCYSYGAVKILKNDEKTKNSKKITVALIQNNSDPWKNGIENYKKDAENLIFLTNQAIKTSENKIDMVVWPETAIVPSILKNYNSEEKIRAERKKIISKVLEFIDSTDCIFVLGNFHDTGEEYFNSAFVFESKKNVFPPKPYIYSKQHLVPFSEYFPYEKQFPKIYNMLLEGDTHLWSAGKDATVFNLTINEKNLRFSCPICFEDNFGRDLKRFCKNGADFFVNLSNDAWSNSVRCQKQHLQMAVFRSVENHIFSVRSTASGVTCIIDKSGRIIKKANEFEMTYLIGEICL